MESSLFSLGSMVQFLAGFGDVLTACLRVKDDVSEVLLMGDRFVRLLVQLTVSEVSVLTGSLKFSSSVLFFLKDALASPLPSVLLAFSD